MRHMKKITPHLLKQLLSTPSAKCEPVPLDSIGDLPTQAELQRLGMVRFDHEANTWARTPGGDIAVQKLCLTLYDWLNDEN